MPFLGQSSFLPLVRLQFELGCLLCQCSSSGSLHFYIHRRNSYGNWLLPVSMPSNGQSSFLRYPSKKHGKPYFFGGENYHYYLIIPKMSVLSLIFCLRYNPTVSENFSSVLSTSRMPSGSIKLLPFCPR